MNLTVKEIERVWLDIPFREVPARNMVRELPHWTLFELCKVELECGVSGYGETMCYYTWGTVSDESVARATGSNAAEIMWDDSLGAGLQMALFDAVGRAMDTPCWALLGKRVRDRVPVSFWDIDMCGEDWLSECQTAVASGYTNFKSKARPWFDLNHQLDVLTAGIPDWLELDMDFNGLLVDTARATRVIQAIEKYDNVAILETPIPQGDIAGMKRIRSLSTLPIAMHYGNPTLQSVVTHDLCDGFVVGGGADAVVRHGGAIAEAEKIFWLQLVGTGMTAAWSVQLATVLTHARWPAVNCHQLYVDQIARPVIEVKDGYTVVPDGPGLGVEPDLESVEKYRSEAKDKPYPAPELIVAIRWPSGGSSYYGHTMAYWKDFQDGKLPLFVPGVYIERVENDGSKDWKDLYTRITSAPVHSGSLPGNGV